MLQTKTFTTTGTKYPQPFFLQMIEYHPAAADNDLLITDLNSQVLYKVRAAGAAANGESSYVEAKAFSCFVNGLIISTIDGGTVYIHAGEG